MTDIARLLHSRSFVELGARQRARAVLDPGSFRELLGPFDRLMSPWLPRQGIVPQADDGVVIAKGLLNGRNAVVAAIEGGFQGGSMGEVGGAKIAGALELAIEDNRNGIPTCAVLLLETGGVRLQEANLGLAAIAEIQAAIVELRAWQPVVGLVAGSVGCFGGMSIAAGLCSHLLVTREARLGLNGPQVIEQRHASGLVDACVADDIEALRERLLQLLDEPSRDRAGQHAWFLERLARLGDDCTQLDAAAVRDLYQGEAK